MILPSAISVRPSSKHIVEPIRVYALEIGGPAERGSRATPNARNRRPAAPLDCGHAVRQYRRRPKPWHFVDGVTESLTTDLSRIQSAIVIARNTAFEYKGRRVDVMRTGRELNVRYVLEGSVQRAGNRMRVNVQLIDAETGEPPLGRAVRQAAGGSLRHAG